MAGFGSLFGFGSSGGNDELPDIYPLQMSEKDFVYIDVFTTYVKILTDVIERTDGLKDDDLKALWDNCLVSESCFGLISLLAKAMTEKTELFLVYESEVLRLATASEQVQIQTDYKVKAESDVGTYISFKNYRRTDMLMLYSALEYCTIGGVNKSARLSKAIQVKISELRGSVSLTDAAAAKSQAKTMATSLANGKDILMDAKDVIETATVDITSAQAALNLMNEKRSFYMGMPSCYITGETTGGLNNSGDADSKAIERGLKNYYYAVIKPAIDSLFDVTTSFKSEDFDQLDSALNALKIFELTSEEYMASENKLKVINKLFGFDPDTKGGPPAPPPTIVVAPGIATPKPGPEKAQGGAPGKFGS